MLTSPSSPLRFTSESATAAAIKLAIIVILFLYPTICSKVFMTYKCIDVNGKLFLVADMTYACFEGALRCNPPIFALLTLPPPSPPNLIITRGVGL